MTKLLDALDRLIDRIYFRDWPDPQGRHRRPDRGAGR